MRGHDGLSRASRKSPLTRRGGYHYPERGWNVTSFLVLVGLVTLGGALLGIAVVGFALANLSKSSRGHRMECIETSEAETGDPN